MHACFGDNGGSSRLIGREGEFPEEVALMQLCYFLLIECSLLVEESFIHERHERFVDSVEFLRELGTRQGRFLDLFVDVNARLALQNEIEFVSSLSLNKE